MNRKFNIATLMLATSLAFAGCANNNAPAKEETPVEENEVVETVEAPAEEEKAAEEATKEEATDDKAAEDMTDEDKADEKEEDKKDETSETPAEEGNVVLHRGYPDIDTTRAFPRIVVATSADKIIGVSIDEYQYFDSDSEMTGVPNSDGEFGKGAKEGKILVSKMENEEAYSADMKEAGGEATLMDNYNAVVDYATGKTISELEDFLNDNKDNNEAIMDALSGATFESSPDLLRMVLEVAKDNTLVTSGNAENPDDVKLQYALGAPHGDKGFADVVVAMEGDKIIAANFDEYQYLGEAEALPGADKAFGENFADSKNVLGSKLINSDSYSKNMEEKAKSTVALKDNFKAIENFVAGKTIAEVKDVVDNSEDGKPVDAVTGATLVDTVGYLQLILDAAEK